ncbi:MAG TPA: hypothetical protein VMF33_03370 [Acidimicrobiales bacterium]|nr:hypothetical protein [Acidimicrobiales bacterium]
MKRIAALTAVLVVMLSCAGASAATPLRHQLLTSRDVRGWTTYDVAAADTRSCPESTFSQPTNKSAVREVFADRSSETLLLEKLVTSPTPTLTYDAVLDHVTKCTKVAATFDGQVTFQRRQSVNLGHFAVPVRAYTVAFVLGGATVTGVIAYAKKGPVVLALAEITMTELSARQFKSTLREALARIS